MFSREQQLSASTQCKLPNYAQSQQTTLPISNLHKRRGGGAWRTNGGAGGWVLVGSMGTPVLLQSLPPPCRPDKEALATAGFPGKPLNQRATSSPRFQ